MIKLTINQRRTEVSNFFLLSRFSSTLPFYSLSNVSWIQSFIVIINRPYQPDICIWLFQKKNESSATMHMNLSTVLYLPSNLCDYRCSLFLDCFLLLLHIWLLRLSLLGRAKLKKKKKKKKERTSLIWPAHICYMSCSYDSSLWNNDFGQRFKN